MMDINYGLTRTLCTNYGHIKLLPSPKNYSHILSYIALPLQNSCGAANYNKLIAYYNNFVITVAPNKMVLRVIGTAEQSFKIKKKT